jgi:hypothetical protein
VELYVLKKDDLQSAFVDFPGLEQAIRESVEQAQVTFCEF